MTRTRILIAGTIVVSALSASAAFGQMPGGSAAAPSRPTTSQPATPDDTRSPMQEQALVPNMAPITTVCGPDNSVTMSDEFGRRYNCRGDRVR